MRVLPGRQDEALEVIRDHVAATGRFPTYRFMRHAMRYASPNSVTQILKALQSKGYIAKLRGKWVLATECCPMCGSKIEAEKSPLTNATPDPVGSVEYSADL